MNILKIQIKKKQVTIKKIQHKTNLRYRVMLVNWFNAKIVHGILK